MKLFIEVSSALLRRIEEAARKAGIPQDDLGRVGLIKICEEMETCGEIRAGKVIPFNLKTLPDHTVARLKAVAETRGVSLDKLLEDAAIMKARNILSRKEVA